MALDGVNRISKDPRFTPRVIKVENKEWLFYPAYQIDTALIRGTTADELGNITLEKEAGLDAHFYAALVTKKCKGIVLAQVERESQEYSLKPKDVRIPGILVDLIVVAKPEHHMQTWTTYYDSGRSGELRIPTPSYPKIRFTWRKIVARRCLMEIKPNMLVNLGAGEPEFIAATAYEEGMHNQFRFIVEAGMIGGIPGFGFDFNTATNPECILDVPSTLDALNGGIHDVTCLGFAQIDKYGNVNVSKYGKLIPGIGGFMDVVNCKVRIHGGRFTAGDWEYEIVDGKLKIKKDGEIIKFVNHVEQVTSAGKFALEIGQKVIIITERAVFEYTPKGLVLKEIAPGIDLEEHILTKMGFKPIVPEDLKQMPNEIFYEAISEAKF